ncbi:MAG: hypothetical protein PVJ57_18500 [Phycisphaerae bacterium]|jgi:hypothetical protein
MKWWIAIACAALPLCVTAAGVRTQLVGFENYALGPIAGQHGWTSTGVTAPEISDEHPSWGQKHLRFSTDENVPSGQRVEAVSPAEYFPSDIDWGFLYAEVSFSDVSPRTTYDLLGRGRDGLPTSGFRFTPDHQILVLDDLGEGPEFVPTGYSWSAGYAFFCADTWPHGQGIDYWCEGVLAYHAGPIGTRIPLNVVLASDNQWGAPGEFMDVDGLAYGWMPEPAMSQLLLCGLVALRHR